MVIALCWLIIRKISLWLSSYLDHIISMSEVAFKSHNVDIFQSLDSDVINLCNRKFGLYTVCKESIALGDLKSVSVISEICNSVNSTGLIVSMRNYVFALIPYLKSFYFFKPCNISYYIQEDVPFVFQF